MILAGQWEPTPPRPGSLDDCMARGFDTDSVRWDRMPVETDPELAALLSRQAQEIQAMRDEDHEWRARQDGAA